MSAGLSPFIRRCFHTALDLIFPLRCAGCGQMGIEWCRSCDRQLVRFHSQLCSQCGRRQKTPGVCSRCRTNPLPLRLRSYALYDGPLHRALLHLKYRPNRRLAAVFAIWLREICDRELWEAELIIPVPLAASRRRQRGYNQVELIALALSKTIGLPHDPRALQRIRDTPSQVGLDPAERWGNVCGAFAARPGMVRGQSVFLVDDLVTTGATLAACASALLSGGAHQVLGLTVARAR